MDVLMTEESALSTINNQNRLIAGKGDFQVGQSGKRCVLTNNFIKDKWKVDRQTAQQVSSRQLAQLAGQGPHVVKAFDTKLVTAAASDKIKTGEYKTLISIFIRGRDKGKEPSSQ